MARSDYIQPVIRPGNWSPVYFLTAVVVILVDTYLVGQQGSGRDNIAIKFTRNPDKGRRIIAGLYFTVAILSAFVVMNYQEDYFTDVGRLGMRDRREVPQSIYPWLYEEYLDCLPQMFQMMHLRSWIGEGATLKPDWSYFIWFSQQYLAGLISFTFFLLTQSHVRQLRIVTMAAFVGVAMTSLSCAHCLMLMFILLTPPLKNRHDWYNIEVLHIVVSLLSLTHHIATGLMTIAIDSPLFQRQLLATMIIPTILPLLSWFLPKVDNHYTRLISISEAQSKVFLTTGLLSFALHLVSIYFMSYGKQFVNPEDLSYQIFFNRSDVDDRIRLGLMDLLKHDPSVAAMCCDVMITLFCLLTWIVVSKVSLWGMIKCSVNPWLETGQRTVWDNRADLGAALGPPSQRSGRLVGREPPFWKMVLAVISWLFGGLGYAVAIVLGAGPRDLDP